MTNPSGEGTPPERPDEARPGEQRPWEQPGAGPAGEQPPGAPGEYQPGYWEQQAQQQGVPYPPYQGPEYPPPPGYAGQVPQYAQDHPKATLSLVLGILGIVVCGVIAPFAWAIGKKTVNEIDASQGQLRGRGSAQAGYIMGIIGTIMLGVGILIGVVVIVATIIGVSTSSGTTY